MWTQTSEFDKFESNEEMAPYIRNGILQTSWIAGTSLYFINYNATSNSNRECLKIIKFRQSAAKLPIG